MRLALAVLIVVLPLSGAAAQESQADDRSSALVDDIAKCREIADSAARLACFDKAAAALQSARDKRELIVVSKDTVKQTRRRLFGIALPRIKLFGDGVAEDEETVVNSITAKIVSAQKTDRIRWRIKFDDGSTWTTLEDFRVKEPKSGDTMEVRRAAMGSFMGSLNGGRAVRMMRVE